METDQTFNEGLARLGRSGFHLLRGRNFLHWFWQGKFSIKNQRLWRTLLEPKRTRVLWVRFRFSETGSGLVRVRFCKINVKNQNICLFIFKTQQWWKLKQFFGIHGRFFWKCSTVEIRLKFANLNKTMHKFNENSTWYHEYLVKNEVCIKNLQILLKF
jgi:hypothetical protein